MAWTKVGSFWKRRSQAGKSFLSGIIDKDKLGDSDKVKVTIWANDKGDNAKRPDFVMYLNEREPAPKSVDNDDSWPDEAQGDAAVDKDEVPF